MSIRLLDKTVYELIAAGEVIERPASVVKELVENSIDAGADKITVEIKNGGRTYIQVSDNGCGIKADEIAIAFQRHATSKIFNKEDLDSIETLGFRGEALASIAAVSKVDVITKRHEDSYGVSCSCDAGVCETPVQTGCSDGTTFIIRDLFFNVPARLKFLKKDVSEGNAIANMVSKIALSHPEISFKFIRDGKIDILTSGDGDLSSAVYSVLGKDFHGSLIPVDYALNGISVNGYVTKPLQARANRSFQNFFVNQRYVKSVTAMMALEEAYRNQIMVGKFPGCVLSVIIDPSATDVNVHPAKLEIRFTNEKPVYDSVYFAVKNALMLYDSPMEGGLSAGTSKVLTHDEIFRQPEPEHTQLSFASPEDLRSKYFSKNDSSDENDTELKTEKIFLSDDEEDLPKKEIFESGKLSYKPSEPEKMPVKSRPDAYVTDEAPKEPIEVVGEVFRTYIVVQRGSDMFLIDKHAAHERYNFDRLKRGVSTADCQMLLKPFEVDLSYEGHTAAADYQSVIERCGFKYEVLDAPKILLKGIPILLTDDDPADLLTQAADDLAAGKNGGADNLFDDLFHSVACKASIKANQFNTAEELKYLAELVINNDILYCPHGRPAIIKFTKYELEKLFKRVQ